MLTKSYRSKITLALRSGRSVSNLRLLLGNGLSALSPMPGLMLAPGQRCREHNESQNNGADDKNTRDWHNSLRQIHHDKMMTWQKELALTWIKCDGFAVCE